jgi:predicted ABC-type ATPase
LLLFLAGPNGAGKSTFFKQFLERTELQFVNADAIAEALRLATPARPRDLDQLAFLKAEQLRGLLRAVTTFPMKSLLLGSPGFCRI